MTRSEYCELLVTLGNHSGSKFLLPNLQSKMILEKVLVTLEFSLDDYNVLLELKERNTTDTVTVSYVYVLYDKMSRLCY